MRDPLLTEVKRLAAAEQLAHPDMAVRLGGIYSLEQISRESPSRYWTAMETLTAFVRKRASWKETAPRVSERAHFLWQEAGRPEGHADEHWCEAVGTTEPPTPRTDIAGVLTVIRRRDSVNHEREREKNWRFNLRGADLRGADLKDVHLERASSARISKTRWSCQQPAQLGHGEVGTVFLDQTSDIENAVAVAFLANHFEPARPLCHFA